MKIVHVNFSDTKGGAAIAVKRIHNLLLKNNNDKANTFISENGFRKELKWKPKITIKNLVKEMIDSELNQLN